MRATTTIAPPPRPRTPLLRPGRAARSRPGAPEVAVAALLVLSVLAAFSPVVDNDFVLWDDDENIVRNPSFRGLGWGSFRWAWTTYHLGVYQPLSWLLLSLEHQLWGLDAFGYHLTSLVLYCVNTAVLYALTLSLLSRCAPRTLGRDALGRAACAGLATGLLAVHPLRAEVVAWASCQPYLPSVLCYMLAILAYLRGHDPARRARGRRWRAATLLLFLAALLFKAVAVSLPAVLVILDVYPLRRIGGRDGWLGPRARAAWLEKVPFAALSLVFIGLAIAAKADAGSVNPVEAWGVGQRVAQSAYGVAFYSWKTLVPLGLSAYYPLPDVLHWTEPRYLALTGSVAAVTAALACLRRRWPALSSAWMAYLAILAPNLGLFSIGRQIAADRYSYLPAFLWSAGLAVAFAGAYRRLGPRGRLGGLGLGLAACSVLLALTWRQCTTWHGTESLFRNALAHARDQRAQLLNSIGVTLFDEGRFPEARSMYEEALREDPAYVHSINNLGVLARRLGRLDEAERYFRAAFGVDRHYVLARRNYARLLIARGRVDEAAEQLTILLRLEPGEPNSLADLARLRAERSRPEEAADLFRSVLRPHPDHRPSRKGLEALTRERQGERKP